MSEEQPTNVIEEPKELFKNKQKVRLTFPYSENPEVKKLGAKWDTVDKVWYYPSIDGTLPDELKQYKAYKVAIEYENKEYLKPILTSMKFDKNQQTWIVNQSDYTKFINMNTRDESKH